MVIRARSPQAEELQEFIAILLSEVRRHADRQAQADIQAAVREQYEVFLRARRLSAFEPGPTARRQRWPPRSRASTMPGAI